MLFLFLEHSCIFMPFGICLMAFECFIFSIMLVCFDKIYSKWKTTKTNTMSKTSTLHLVSGMLTSNLMEYSTVRDQSKTEMLLTQSVSAYSSSFYWVSCHWEDTSSQDYPQSYRYTLLMGRPSICSTYHQRLKVHLQVLPSAVFSSRWSYQSASYSWPRLFQNSLCGASSSWQSCCLLFFQS